MRSVRQQWDSFVVVVDVVGSWRMASALVSAAGRGLGMELDLPVVHAD